MLFLQKSRGEFCRPGCFFLVVSILTFTVACSDATAVQGAKGNDHNVAEEECGGLLSTADVMEAFEGALTVKNTTVAAIGKEVAGCLIMIEEGVNNRLNFTIGDSEDFTTRKESQLRQTGGAHEVFQAGKEAHIFNNSYVVAISEDGRSISLGLSPKVIGEENLLSPEQGATGMKLLTERILSRLPPM